MKKLRLRNCPRGTSLVAQWLTILLRDRNKDADVENGLEDTGRGKGKLGRSERVAWTYMHYQM